MRGVKNIFYYFIGAFIIPACTEDLDDFNNFQNYGEFSLNGKEITFPEKFMHSQHAFTVYDSNGKLDSVKIVVGRGYNNGRNDVNGMVNFYILKSFLTEDLGLDPQKFKKLETDPEFKTTQIKPSSDGLYSVFSELGNVVRELPTSFKANDEDRDGISMTLQYEGEYYVTIPKVVIDNQEKRSVFSLERTKHFTTSKLKAEILFDVYMQSESTSTILHLENGKFIVTYEWQ